MTFHDEIPSRRRRAFRVLVLVAMLAGIALAVPFCISRRSNQEIVAIAYLDGVVSVQIRSQFYGRIPRPPRTELVSFDLASGDRVGSLDLGATTVQYPAVGTHAWVERKNGKLALVDVRIPAIVIQPGELAKHIPELAAGFELRRREGQSTVQDGAVADHVTRTPDAMQIVLADGALAWLDPAPRLVSYPPPAAVRNPVGYRCFYYDAPSCEQRRCFTWVGAEHTTVRQLGWNPVQRGPLRWSADEPPELAGADPAPLHAPAFVKRLDRRCALEVDGGVLVRHESSAIAPRHRLLSLLAPDGTLRWSRRVDELAGDDAMPIAGLLVGDRIQLLLGDAWKGESLALHELRSRRLVLVHLAAGTGEMLLKRRLW